MAAAMLWLLDSSANISMVPFRAFVGDLLPQEQRTQGFAMQSVMVGIGAIAASSLPWLLNHLFAIDASTRGLRQIPLTVELSFYIGAILFLSTMLWTILTTGERPPHDWDEFEELQAENSGLFKSLQATGSALMQMPKTMQQLAWVQIFTWLGIFCFFIYFPPAVAHNIFGATDFDSPVYNAGIEWAGLCFATFNIVCIVFSFLLPFLTRWTSRKVVHGTCLAIGGLSLISLVTVSHPSLLLVAMIGFGMTWASAQAIPYAILTHTIPTQQRGIYQGIFNLFIVLPEIGVALGFGWVMQYWLQDNHLLAVVVGGGFLLLAAMLMPFVQAATPAPEEDRLAPSAPAPTEEQPAVSPP
jgi:maltose/moltooligosaccharide transporter